MEIQLKFSRREKRRIKAVEDWEKRSALKAAEQSLTGGDETHEWFDFSGMICCRQCGIVRRRDRMNKPCRGPVGIALR
jgi:hypothetical protein